MSTLVGSLDPDARFFAEHPTRQAHIRVALPHEREDEFQTLGFHDPKRRRIISWKVPRGQPMAGTIHKLPMIVFADEEIADTDETVLPVMHEFVVAAAKEQGISLPAMPRMQ